MFFSCLLNFNLGETWVYDNTGYHLSAIIIEKASGKSYWQFLDERIFKPLGMVLTMRSTDPQPLVETAPQDMNGKRLLREPANSSSGDRIFGGKYSFDGRRHGQICTRRLPAVKLLKN